MASFGIAQAYQALFGTLPRGPVTRRAGRHAWLITVEQDPPSAALVAAARRADREAIACAQREIRRRYQKELRAAAPVRSRALRKSIRVRSKRGRGYIDFKAQMRFYGFIINGRGPHRGWITEVEDQLIEETGQIIQDCVNQALVNNGLL